MSYVVASGVLLLALTTVGAVRPAPRARDRVPHTAARAVVEAHPHAPGAPGMPAGWQGPPPAESGAVPADYEVGVDDDVRHGGAASAYVRSIATEPRAFMSIVQGFRAEAYRGRRVRLSGYVRTQDVAGHAALWMQIIGPDGSAGFDNMDNRPIRGTSQWTRYAVVLDVPADGGIVAFGFLLRGRGQAWVDDLRFDIVGPDVVSTNTQSLTPAESAARPDLARRVKFAEFVAAQRTQPSNLDFAGGMRADAAGPQAGAPAAHDPAAPAAAAPNDAPDYSGTWQLDAGKSDFGEGTPPASWVMKVRHAGSRLEVVRDLRTDQLGARHDSVAYVVGGPAATYTNVYGPTTARAAMDGADLVITATLRAPDGVENPPYTSRWSLSPDGRELTVVRVLTNRDGDRRTIRLVFDRQ